MNGTVKQTTSQKQDMIYDFLRQFKGQTFDGITARNQMRQVWGIDYDWHDFSEVLAHMETIGKAERINGRDELRKYMIG
jgi:hypothetical protein